MGRYMGGDIIYLSETLKPEDRFTIYLHEVVHYVHVKQGLVEIPGPAYAICWSEDEAWDISDEYSGVRHPGWFLSYPHCQKFYRYFLRPHR